MDSKEEPKKLKKFSAEKKTRVFKEEISPRSLTSRKQNTKSNYSDKVGLNSVPINTKLFTLRFIKNNEEKLQIVEREYIRTLIKSQKKSLSPRIKQNPSPVFPKA